MKKVLLFLLLVLSTSCFLLTVNVWNQTNVARLQTGIACEVIRFHVRANSEELLDQKIKMQVKDAVISYLQPVLDETNNVSQAKLLLTSHLPGIQQVAENVLQTQNCFYAAEVSLREEYFPRKTYGDCTFPEGDYSAVVIELGSGKGRNWWCMLYPGLCFVDETYAVVSDKKKEELQYVLTEDEYEWVTNPENRKVTFLWGLCSAVEGMVTWING